MTCQVVRIGRPTGPEAEHRAEHAPGVVEVVRAEEHPGDVHQRIRQDAQEQPPGPRFPQRELAPGLLHEPLADQEQPVQSAPDDKRPGGAVPQAAEQHRQHQVDVGAARALAVAAQRHVEVVAQPGRQRDVPASPEVREADRRVRIAEVVDQRDAEHQRRADRRRRVAGEVAEDLSRRTPACRARRRASATHPWHRRPCRRPARAGRPRSRSC